MNKRICVLILLLLLGSLSLVARGDFKKLTANDYRVSNGVRVFFTMQGRTSAQAVIDRVTEIMRVKDPMGWKNPYWIVGIVDQATDGNRGVIIGRWYKAGYPGWSLWQEAMRERLEELRSQVRRNQGTAIEHIEFSQID